MDVERGCILDEVEGHSPCVVAVRTSSSLSSSSLTLTLPETDVYSSQESLLAGAGDTAADAPADAESRDYMGNEEEEDGHARTRSGVAPASHDAAFDADATVSCTAVDADMKTKRTFDVEGEGNIVLLAVHQRDEEQGVLVNQKNSRGLRVEFFH